jgi:hypothetical protein
VILNSVAKRCALMAVCAWFVCAPACEKKPVALAPADQTYTVPGTIAALPVRGDVRQPLKIHHEVIPHFVGRDGAVIGMAEMSMPFPDVAPGVDLSTLTIGQRVEFTFEVRWRSEPRSLVTKIVPLSPESPDRVGEDPGKSEDRPTNPG